MLLRTPHNAIFLPWIGFLGNKWPINALTRSVAQQSFAVLLLLISLGLLASRCIVILFRNSYQASIAGPARSSAAAGSPWSSRRKRRSRFLQLALSSGIAEIPATDAVLGNGAAAGYVVVELGISLVAVHAGCSLDGAHLKGLTLGSNAGSR
ncbi:hypothetical protein HG530_003158 [Fusarium avenaceum]|nr:hypothetical protein HG530_003158 [Fusarium avenaceum]